MWLGGRKLYDQWQWGDNTSWSFTNWMNGSPSGYENLIMRIDGTWDDFKGSWEHNFLCQGTTVALSETGLTTIELEEDQLAFLPFYVLFERKTLNYEMSNKSQDEDRRISGFSLDWFLKDSNGMKITEKLPAREDDWRQDFSAPMHKHPLLHDMVLLAKELRLQNMTKDKILMEVIHQKSQMRVMPEVDEMCLFEQVKRRKQKDFFSELISNASTNQTSGEISEEDIKTGYELFHAVIFCPAMTFKMYTFIDQLLTTETSRTIIHAIVHLQQSGAITDRTSFTSAKHFYQVLASTLDLQYGDILLATSSNLQRGAALRKGLPFFLNHTDPVKRCILESNCDALGGIFQNIGVLLSVNSLTPLFLIR